MNTTRRYINSMLNRFTMYTGLLYCLITLLLAAEIMAAIGVIGISALGLLCSIAGLMASCYLANKLFSSLFKVPTNRESWLITALIMACILPPSSNVGRLGLIALAGALAMASKYVLVARGTPIFNPAAAGVFILSVIGLLPATWWIATPPLAPVAGIIGLAVLYKQRKFSLFWAFSLMATALLLYISVALHDQSFTSAFSNAWLSWPIIFLGSIMLTEPSTMPRGRYMQVLYGLLVGAIFASQLHIGSVSATPQLALLAGNLFAFIVTPAAGYLLKLREQRKVADDIYEFTFHKPKGLRFNAGQYMEWTLPHKQADLRGNRRTFSISSSPLAADLQFAIRVDTKHSSSYKRALLAMQPGQIIRAAHVEGEFTLPTDLTRPLLFIAGGIGVTPFISMLRLIAARQAAVNIRLIYIASNDASLAFKDVIGEAEPFEVRIDYHIGRLETVELQKLVPDINQRLVYVSGPDAMVTDYAHHVRQLGVLHVKTDHFSGY